MSEGSKAEREDWREVKKSGLSSMRNMNWT